MKKQLTMIKVAGVAVSLAAAGIAGMASANPVLEHTADYQELHPQTGETTGPDQNDVSVDDIGEGFTKVQDSDKITVDGIELAQQGDLDKLQQQVDLNTGQLETISGVLADVTGVKEALDGLENSQVVDTTLTEDQVDDFVSDNGYADQAIVDHTNSVQDGLIGDNTDAINTKQNQLTQDQLDSFTADSDTQLTEDQVDAFVDNNGYAKTDDVNAEVAAAIAVSQAYTDDATNGLATTDDVNAEVAAAIAVSQAYTDDAIAGIETTVDTTLTEAQVDAYADNNGYAQDNDVKSNDADISVNSSAINGNIQDIAALEAKTAGISNNNGNIGISAGDGTVIVATDNFYVEDSAGNAELVATEDYVDAANANQDAALAAGLTTGQINVETPDTDVLIGDISSYNSEGNGEGVFVYTPDAEITINENGVHVDQYHGKGDVSVEDESLLNNAADIDVLQDSAVSIDENGQVSTKGHSNTYEVNGYTYTDNGHGSYTTDDPAQAGKFFSEGYLADTLGGTVTNPEPDLVTEGELQTALDGIVGTAGTAGSNGIDGVDGQDGADGAAGADGADGADGQDGAKGDTGADGAKGDKGDTGATGAAGRDGRDGQDATIAFNDQGQAVLSAANGSVAVATDEQVTVTKSELSDLISKVAEDAAASAVAEAKARVAALTEAAEDRLEIQELALANAVALVEEAEARAEAVEAEAEARIAAIQAEAEERIKGLAEAAEERIQIKNIAVSNTVAIVSLEQQWKTDPVIGATKITDNQGNVVVHTAPDGSTEDKVARIHNPTTIAERVADNTSRIQALESAVFTEVDNEDAADRYIASLWGKAKLAKQKNEPLYVMTSAGMVDLRGWSGSSSRHGHGIMIALDKALAYDVMDLNSVWVTLK